MALRTIAIRVRDPVSRLDTSTMGEHDSFAKKAKLPRKILRVAIRNLLLGCLM